MWAVPFKRNATDPSSVASADALQQDGIFLGWTDNHGSVTYTFEKGGWYLIAAFKDGHMPGFAWSYAQFQRQLAIKAPAAAAVGEEVTVTVFEQNSRIKIAGAGVWALHADDPAVLRIDALTASGDVEDQADVVTGRGIFLGKTNDEGQVTHKFDQAGGYYLVAVKDGYIPAIAKITIKEYVRALAIKAPETALVGEEVTITVYERNVGAVVAGADVWALPAEEASANTGNRQDLIAIAMEKGIFLGKTNDEGQVTHKFDQAGGYYLVAVKDGYVPGLGKITIKPPVATPVPLTPAVQTKPTTVRPIGVDPVKKIAIPADSAANLRGANTAD